MFAVVVVVFVVVVHIWRWQVTAIWVAIVVAVVVGAVVVAVVVVVVGVVVGLVVDVVVVQCPYIYEDDNLVPSGLMPTFSAVGQLLSRLQTFELHSPSLNILPIYICQYIIYMLHSPSLDNILPTIKVRQSNWLWIEICHQTNEQWAAFVQCSFSPEPLLRNFITKENTIGYFRDLLSPCLRPFVFLRKLFGLFCDGFYKCQLDKLTAEVNQ